MKPNAHTSLSRTARHLQRAQKCNNGNYIEASFFRYLDYVSTRHFPFLSSLNSNSCSLLFHFFQGTCSEVFNTDHDEENNPVWGLIKIDVFNKLQIIRGWMSILEMQHCV